MTFIPSRDHIPSLEDRVGKSRRSPIVLHTGEVAVGYGIFGIVLNLIDKILDLFGKGESAIDIYRTLPSLLKFLENPAVSIAAVVVGFLALWHQGRYIDPASKPTLIHGLTLRPITSEPRIKPVMKRSLLSAVTAFVLACFIWVALETPLRDFVFVKRLEIVDIAHSPSAPTLPQGNPSGFQRHKGQRATSIASPNVTTPTQKPAPQPGPPAVNFPQSASPMPTSPGTGIYERVQQFDRDINGWDGDYRVQIYSIKSDAMRPVAMNRAENSRNPNSPTMQAQTAQLQQTADAKIRDGYLDLSTQANLWMEQQQNKLIALHQDAISHMKMAKPDIWTPHAVEEDARLFGEAMSAAGKKAAFSDIEKETMDPERFKPLCVYFDKLAKQLSNYPDT